MGYLGFLTTVKVWRDVRVGSVAAAINEDYVADFRVFF